MAEFSGLMTHQHLIAAFQEEAVVAYRYLYFAKLADIEGRPEIAQLFRDMAEGGICNAHGCLDFLRLEGDPLTSAPIGEIDRNLKASLLAETREFTERYPEMASQAQAEGFPDIASWFETLTKLKRAHAQQLDAVLSRLDSAREPR
ncbi:MAG: rubrerythrin family protein [Pseudomonadota bacterium]